MRFAVFEAHTLPRLGAIAESLRKADHIASPDQLFDRLEARALYEGDPAGLTTILREYADFAASNAAADQPDEIFFTEWTLLVLSALHGTETPSP